MVLIKGLGFLPPMQRSTMLRSGGMQWSPYCLVIHRRYAVIRKIGCWSYASDSIFGRRISTNMIISRFNDSMTMLFGTDAACICLPLYVFVEFSAFVNLILTSGVSLSFQREQ